MNFDCDDEFGVNSNVDDLDRFPCRGQLYKKRAHHLNSSMDFVSIEIYPLNLPLVFHILINRL